MPVADSSIVQAARATSKSPLRVVALMLGAGTTDVLTSVLSEPETIDCWRSAAVGVGGFKRGYMR
ncbi:MAG: hypothetical protein WBL23_17350 [Salinisphaera sp.]|uniref:hypothetical protein n=1 Tax=Salinisphaera sp. TaxID=1914330 RepID=UPI003C7B865A